MVENASAKLRAEEKKFSKAEDEFNKAVSLKDQAGMKKAQIKMMTARHGMTFYRDQLNRGLAS